MTLEGKREVDLHRAQLRNMAALQDRHNRQVHADWRNQGYAYYRAVWIECAELLDHIGWKWWRRQQRDVEQARLEVVDIWHFGLSDLLRANAVNDALADRMAARAAATEGADLRAAVERLALGALKHENFDIDAFVDVMNALPMRLDELHDIYVGKNVLNAFRQDHGYRDGSYLKIWNGREDNAHLAEIAAGLDIARPSYADDLYAALQARYTAATQG